MAAVLCFLAACSSEPVKRTETAPPPPAQAPETFRVKFETTKGDFLVEVVREWAPHGVDRFHELVTKRYYDGTRFFRVVPRFVVQWGIHGDPKVQSLWRTAVIPDDPVRQSNKRGFLTYAKSGPQTRTTQVFINLADNARLDADGFAPFGHVIEGMDVVDQLHKLYGEAPPGGVGPDQMRIQAEGNPYLDRYFPRLDAVKTARIVE
ncbi:MAG: peptidylprolyl isomerase [Bryobacterales bacterium]|nr:peptidylprolyl isomerase [Bryobacterales bacterium]